MSSILHDLYKQLLIVSTPFQQEFTDTFRSSVASDVAEIFTGISSLTKINSLEYSCQHVAEFALEQDSDKYSHLASQLYGPVQKALFESLKHSATTDRTVNRVSDQIEKIKLQKITKTKDNSKEKNKVKVKKPDLPTKKVGISPTDKDGKSSDRPILKATLVTPIVSLQARERTNEIVEHLLAVSRSGHHLYQKFCTSTGCTFCTDLFQKLAVTPCHQDMICDHVELHKGLNWYPHLGKTLRGILRKAHRSDAHFNSKNGPSTAGLGTLQDLLTTYDPEASTSSSFSGPCRDKDAQPVEARLPEVQNPSRKRTVHWPENTMDICYSPTSPKVVASSE
jgi:hypothetical protein